MAEYRISQEVAHQLAVGLYRQAGAFVAAAKRDSPDEFERFKAAYLEKQSPQPVKRRCARTRQNVLR